MKIQYFFLDKSLLNSCLFSLALLHLISFNIFQYHLKKEKIEQILPAYIFQIMFVRSKKHKKLYRINKQISNNEKTKQT